MFDFRRLLPIVVCLFLFEVNVCSVMRNLLDELSPFRHEYTTVVYRY
jgi:hypothetical protein